MDYVSLPEIALQLRDLYPDLEKRCFTALGDDISKDNMPLLPFSVVIPLGVSAEDYPKKNNGRVNLSDEFQIEFWLKPMRVKNARQMETPFWAFYDYKTSFLEPLIVHFVKLSQENGAKFEFLGAMPAITDEAAIISVRFRQYYTLCDDLFAEETTPIGKIQASISSV